MPVVYSRVAHVLAELSKDESNVCSRHDHCVHQTSDGLLVFSDVDPRIVVVSRAEVFVTSGGNSLWLESLLSDSEFVEYAQKVLFLVDFNSLVLSVASDSSSKNLTDLPQVLGVEPR